MTKIAAVSVANDPRDTQKNIDVMIDYIEKAADQGVELIVFPEEHMQGFGTKGMNEFFPPDKLHMVKEAQLIPEGPGVQTMIEQAKKHSMYISWGMTERDPDRWSITHNCNVLVGPEGFVGKYRKVHLPLSERMFHVPGSEYHVFDTALGKIGLLVCYDMMYPEAPRALALQGADIILCPTGWPNMTQSEDDPDHQAYRVFSEARAAENQVFWVQATSSNSRDPEAPQVFEGHSQILGPNPGQVFARGTFEEGMVVADVDIKEEIQHARVVALGGSDLVRDRKPSTYGSLVEVNPFANFADGIPSD